jgi:hypothetical protein
LAQTDPAKQEVGPENLCVVLVSVGLESWYVCVIYASDQGVLQPVVAVWNFAYVSESEAEHVCRPFPRLFEDDVLEVLVVPIEILQMCRMMCLIGPPSIRDSNEASQAIS